MAKSPDRKYMYYMIYCALIKFINLFAMLLTVICDIIDIFK